MNYKRIEFLSDKCGLNYNYAFAMNVMWLGGWMKSNETNNLWNAYKHTTSSRREYGDCDATRYPLQVLTVISLQFFAYEYDALPGLMFHFLCLFYVCQCFTHFYETYSINT